MEKDISIEKEMIKSANTDKMDEKLVEKLNEQVKQLEEEKEEKIVNDVLDEVLAVDGEVRLKGLFNRPMDRMFYRDQIKMQLNKNYGYNLPIKYAELSIEEFKKEIMEVTNKLEEELNGTNDDE